MSPRLTSLSLTNFRSIRGSLALPLDAPVVLLHGPNGTGKTSVLSAIELALTGEIPSLARFDEDYRSHLVHKDFSESHISLATSGLDGPASTSMVISGDRVVGQPLLGGV